MTHQDYGSLLKAKLARRERLLVVNIDYSNASLVEFLGSNGADVILIDCEQGDTDIGAVPDLVRAAHIAGKPALLRVPSPEPSIIERYLARGIDELVIPRLETTKQVQDAVDAVDYCRPNSRNSTAIIVQIETLSAAQCVRDICSIEAIDALFVGPVDLAKSMGYGADYHAPKVAAEIDRLIDATRLAGRCVGMLVTAEDIRRNAERGVSFLYLHTNDFIRAGSMAFTSATSEAGGR